MRQEEVALPGVLTESECLQPIRRSEHARTHTLPPPPSHTHTPLRQSLAQLPHRLSSFSLWRTFSPALFHPSVQHSECGQVKFQKHAPGGCHQVRAGSQQRWGGGASICVRAWGPSSWLSRTGLQALKPLSIPLGIPDGGGESSPGVPRHDGWAVSHLAGEQGFSQEQKLRCTAAPLAWLLPASTVQFPSSHRDRSASDEEGTASNLTSIIFWPWDQ